MENIEYMKKLSSLLSEMKEKNLVTMTFTENNRDLILKFPKKLMVEYVREAFPHIKQLKQKNNVRYNRETRQFDNLPQERIDRYKKLYNLVDVDKEMEKMKLWLDRKLRRIGNDRFINNWLSKAQESVSSREKMQKYETESSAVKKGKYFYNKYQNEIIDILKYLSEKTRGQFTFGIKNMDSVIKIGQILELKFTVEQIKEVIEYQSMKFLDTDKQYMLMPATLFKDINFTRNYEIMMNAL